MSRFNFRFQPVLSLKKQMEDNQKNELGKAVRKLEDQKEVLTRIELNQQECLNEMKDQASESINVKTLCEYNIFLGLLRKNLQNQRENVKAAEETVNYRRAELVQAVKERETLDKLREKHLALHHRYQLMQEQKLNDEIAGYAYNKKLAGE